MKYANILVILMLWSSTVYGQESVTTGAELEQLFIATQNPYSGEIVIENDISCNGAIDIIAPTQISIHSSQGNAFSLHCQLNVNTNGGTVSVADLRITKPMNLSQLDKVTLQQVLFDDAQLVITHSEDVSLNGVTSINGNSGNSVYLQGNTGLVDL